MSIEEMEAMLPEIDALDIDALLQASDGEWPGVPTKEKPPARAFLEGAWIQMLPAGPLNLCDDGKTAKRDPSKNMALKGVLALMARRLMSMHSHAPTEESTLHKQTFNERAAVLEQLTRLQGLPRGGAPPPCAFFSSKASLPGFERNGFSVNAAFHLASPFSQFSVGVPSLSHL